MSIFFPNPCALGYWGHWLCSAQVKVAINLTTWSPSSFEPGGTYVAAADLTLTLVSSVHSQLSLL